MMTHRKDSDRIRYARDLVGQEQEKVSRNFRPWWRSEVCERTWKGRATEVGVDSDSSSALRQVDQTCGESLSQNCPWWRSPLSHRNWPASCPHMLSPRLEQPLGSMASGCLGSRFRSDRHVFTATTKNLWIFFLSSCCFWSSVILPGYVKPCAT